MKGVSGVVDPGRRWDEERAQDTARARTGGKGEQALLANVDGSTARVIVTRIGCVDVEWQPLLCEVDCQQRLQRQDPGNALAMEVVGSQTSHGPASVDSRSHRGHREVASVYGVKETVERW